MIPHTLHVDNPAGLPEAEVAAYVRRAEDWIARGWLPADTSRLVLRPTGDGEEIEIAYYRSGDGVHAFDRIRRITGYLVGTLDRFNDAKRAEERDRVKHLAAGSMPSGLPDGDAAPDPEEETTARIRAEEAAP